MLMAKMFQNLQNQDQPSTVKVEVLIASTLYQRKSWKFTIKFVQFDISVTCYSMATHRVIGARICEYLWSPGIDSKESILSAYAA